MQNASPSSFFERLEKTAMLGNTEEQHIINTMTMSSDQSRHLEAGKIQQHSVWSEALRKLFPGRAGQGRGHKPWCGLTPRRSFTDTVSRAGFPSRGRQVLPPPLPVVCTPSCLCRVVPGLWCQALPYGPRRHTSWGDCSAPSSAKSSAHGKELKHTQEGSTHFRSPFSSRILNYSFIFLIWRLIRC